MNPRIRTGYENIGASSYITAALPPDGGLIHYQLEMAVSNEISHFLPVSKRMLDGETIIYYNITSKEALCLVKGAVSAIRDAREYQLPMAGLIMEPDYIYVDPATCEPGFLFLPVTEPGSGSLKELLLNLVMQGRIEMSNDNFVQVLLETLNQEPLSIDALEKCIDRYGAAGSAGSDMKPGFQPQNQPVRTPKIPQPVSMQPVQAIPVIPAAPVQSDSIQMAGISGASESVPPDLPKPSGKMKAGKPEKKRTGKVKKQNAPQNSEGETGFDREAAKKKFLLPQAIVMVALAASVSFGLFLDGTGKPAVTNILAAAIVVALFEVILYREVYINSKQSGKEKPGKRKDKKSGGATSAADPVSVKDRPLPKRPESAAVRQSQTGYGQRSSASAAQSDYGQRSQQVSAAQSDYGQRPQVSAPQEDYRQHAWTPAQQPALQPQGTGLQPLRFSGDSDTDLNMETELFDGFSGDMPAYLEFYENGLMTRIPLDKPSVLVGRLIGQVDFVVSNPRVGKVHAEFIRQDGHYYVKDISSKNGTYINDSGRINSNIPYPLHDNDRIKLADSEFTIRCSG